MVHVDGVKAEDYFEEVMRNALPSKQIIRCHRPFDFLINQKHVEVKSAKLYVNQSNGMKKYAHGQYECWNKSQMQRLKGNEVWVCFIIHHDNQHIIHGFCKSSDLPKKRKFTMTAVQHVPLFSTKQFIKYMKQTKDK